jgi:hypothetical protein
MFLDIPPLPVLDNRTQVTSPLNLAEHRRVHIHDTVINIQLPVVKQIGFLGSRVTLLVPTTNPVRNGGGK